MIDIIDNFLNKDLLDNFNKEIKSGDFPFYFQDGKSKIGDGYFQFVHSFYENYQINSNYFNLVEPVLNLLKVKSLVRIKLNVTHKDIKFRKFDFHTDNDFNCNTAIYYLNTNNGKTIFENGKEVNSVENRIVKFKSNIRHAATSTTDKDFRFVLNINYF